MGYPADLVLRFRKTVLVAAVVLAVIGGAASASLFGKLTAGGFYPASGEADRAAAVLENTFGIRTPNLVLLVDAPAGLDDKDAVVEGTRLTERLSAESGVSNVVSYWNSSRSPQLRSESGKQALILATVDGDETTVAERMRTLLPSYSGTRDGLRVSLGGDAMFQKEMGEQSQKDAAFGEEIAFPVTLLVLVLVFGSVVSASIPLIVAFIATLIQLGVLWVVASLTDTSVFAISVSSLLGLGLAIDYSLLMVNRYREETRAGASIPDAIRAMSNSAGRTVLFSAVIVSLSMASLLWFPLVAVRSIAYSGIATALLSAAAALTVLPAMLAVLGPRIDKGRLIKRADPGAESRFWRRTAVFVMSRPVRLAVIVGAVLLALALPALNMRLGMPDERIMGESSPVRQVSAQIRANFDSADQNSIPVVATDTGGQTDRIGDYAATLSRLSGVARVDSVGGTYVRGVLTLSGNEFQRFGRQEAAYFSVEPDPGIESPTALVTSIRATQSPFPVLVGGAAALNIDTTEVLTSRLPYALVTVAVLMVIVLFLLTGSVVLPLVALLLSALSLTAAFGALVWVFQDGHLSGLLGFTATGTTISTIPVMLFGLAFGLAMDYQVFMLARIREEYERTGSTVEAVASGLARIGRIVTAAAVVISIVFLAFMASDIAMVKAYGLGLPLVVLMDATLIRGVMLPAVLRILERFVWWAPPALKRIHERFGVVEAGSSPRFVEPGAPVSMS